MRKSLRQFYCARCHQYCEIGSCCDRGNIYCGFTCATAARAASLLAAGKRYQKSFKGAIKNALRQARYRARLRLKKDLLSKIVTHHPSPLLIESVVLQTPVERLFEIAQGCCHFCGRYVGDLIRRSFYKRRGGVRRAFGVAKPCGP